MPSLTRLLLPFSLAVVAILTTITIVTELRSAYVIDTILLVESGTELSLPLSAYFERPYTVQLRFKNGTAYLISGTGSLLQTPCVLISGEGWYIVDYVDGMTRIQSYNATAIWQITIGPGNVTIIPVTYQHYDITSLPVCQSPSVA